MATVTKDFRIKSGLVVEGTTGTINGSPILTEAASVEFLQDTIGGMVASNTESGISVEYDDTSGKLNFNVGDPVITIAGDVDGNATMTNLGDTTITVTLDTVNTAVGTYGTSTAIPAITVDGKGRVTNVTTSSISTTLGIAGDTGTDSVALGTDTLTFEGGTGITSTVSNNKVKVDIDSTVATLTDQQTLTNKTLTSPKINEDVAVTATATELNVLDGITSSTAELNILDGVTSTAAELNILDGATLTVTELNYVDGVTSAIQTQLDGKLDESGGTMTGAIAMGTNKITGLGTPTDATDAATKAYVDSAAQGIDWKASVRAATTTAVTLASGLENGDTLDGVTLATGNRILVKNQSTGSENGIYVVQATGAPTRSTDADTAAELTSNFAVFVEEGTLNADQGYVLTNDGTITVGTTALVFTQFTGLGQVTAGTGLDKTGNTIDIDSTVVTLTGSQALTNKTLTSPKINEDVALTATATELNVLDGITSSTAELNILDGVTSTAVELNILDGATLTTTELNYVDGVTSAIQTQLNAKATPADITTAVDAITTTVIEEGTNLYFTNARAVTALEAVVPNFEEVRIDSLAKQVAAQVSAPTAATAVTAFAFAKASYRSAKFLVKVAYSTHTEISEVLLTLDTSDNIAITEYAVVGTNGSASGVSADIDGTNVRLRVTPVNASSTVTVMGTLLV